MGTSFFAKEILIALNKLNIDIVAVVSQPDKKINRSKKIINTPVKSVAKELNLKIMQPENISSITEDIKKLKPDFIITCAYGQFIPNFILNIPTKDSINIHASYLPKLRGGAPIHWAIINGDKYSGISIIRMIKKMDAGPIFLQKKISIDIKDTMINLQNKLINLAKIIIHNDFMKIMNGKYKIKEQKESEISFAYNITRDDEKLNFNDSTLNIYNKIRGLYDKPIAYGLLNNVICKIYEADFFLNKTNNKIKNGTIVKLDNKGIHLKTKDGFIILKKIQFSGKNIQETKWFYKNAPKKIIIGGIYE